MPDPKTKSDVRTQFEVLCASIDDYEHLPEVAPGPADTTPLEINQDHEDSINAKILAGLVWPKPVGLAARTAPQR